MKKHNLHSRGNIKTVPKTVGSRVQTLHRDDRADTGQVCLSVSSLFGRKKETEKNNKTYLGSYSSAVLLFSFSPPKLCLLSKFRLIFRLAISRQTRHPETHLKTHSVEIHVKFVSVPDCVCSVTPLSTGQILLFTNIYSLFC